MQAGQRRPLSCCTVPRRPPSGPRPAREDRRHFYFPIVMHNPQTCRFLTTPIFSISDPTPLHTLPLYRAGSQNPVPSLSFSIHSLQKVSIYPPTSLQGCVASAVPSHLPIPCCLLQNKPCRTCENLLSRPLICRIILSSLHDQILQI